MRNVSLIFLYLFVSAVIVQAQDSGERTLTFQEFIELATSQDTEFQSILIDELPLQYRKDLNLPARDIVLSAAGEYDLFLSQDEREETDTTVSLSKLFPMTATELTAEYSSSPSFNSLINSSEFALTVSQPIAENAFGKATRLRDKIIGVEIDVIKHQVVEAYEDYLATVMTAYLNWYEAYENLKIGESSYEENLKLMDNIKERQKSSIALPIDVNKINLQVLDKKEKLVDLREKYASALNFIEKSIRHDGSTALKPVQPDVYRNMDIHFDEHYEQFRRKGRTYLILDLLEKKGTLDVDKNADDLLPSINVLIGYKVDGDNYELDNDDNLVFAGLSVEWPFSDQVETADYETSKIAEEKQKLITANTHYRLYTNINNLFQVISREEQLKIISSEKIGLAESVLRAETENYSFGKVTINDYIQAVNTLDNNRFDQILHDVQYRRFLIEWLRITDRLINKKEIKPAQ